eukprot:6736410-Pyramimonas_sp.AAC.1
MLEVRAVQLPPPHPAPGLEEHLQANDHVVAATAAVAAAAEAVGVGAAGAGAVGAVAVAVAVTADVEG